MNGIIDFHAHAFADDLAERAMTHLTSKCDVPPCHDGRLSSLKESMAEAGIIKSVVCPIATKPKQFEGILEWCGQIKDESIEPFPSIHPADEQAIERMEAIKLVGFKGIKMHPYYQEYVLDEDRLMPIYEKAVELNLMVVPHCGYDIAFEFDDRAAPFRIANICKTFPKLKFVATHFGGWKVWDIVEKDLIGKNIYMEISFSLTCLEPEVAKRMILSHPEDCLLFGTDSPWQGQKLTVELLKELGLPKLLQDKMLWQNAQKLLS